MLKNKKITVVIVVILSIGLLLSLISTFTYALFSREDYGANANAYSTGTLSIEAKSKSEKISLDNALPMNDEEGITTTPYIFTIRNTGNIDYQFDVLLTSTGNEEETFPSQYIKLQIDDGNVTTLSELTEGKINSEPIILLAGQSIDISIRTWLSEKITNDYIGRTFNSQISISGQAIYTSTETSGNKLIDHIRNQYASNVSSTPTDTGNGTYYYADSVQLMNDGLDSTGTVITDTTSLLAGTSGNIRYYGAEGDSLNNYIYFNCDTYPETNCEKWRIIGIVDGKIKIMRGEQIGTYSWDYTSTREYNNKWSDATLMTMLNDGYYYSEDNVSYYNNSTTPVTINFGNPGVGEVKGITAATRTNDIIDTEAMWYTNGSSSASVYPNAMYKTERTGTSTWPGAISLAYPSDYGYAADLRTCKQQLVSYSFSTCTSVNWMKNIITSNGSKYGWLIIPSSSDADGAWNVGSVGNVGGYNVNYADGVSPVLYLNSEVVIESEGDGTSGNPYRINT